MQTPVLEIEALRTQFGVPLLYVKDESAQVHGTWKDRRSRFIIERAQKEGIQKLVLITSGNAGYSLSRIAEGTGIRVICVIDRALSPSIKRTLNEICFNVIERDLSEKVFTSEGLLLLAREYPSEKIWDVTNGFEEAYESLIDELAFLKPEYIICPVGSGEAFTGLSSGIRKHQLSTRLIGVSPSEKRSLADKLVAHWTPYERRIAEGVSAGNTHIRVSEHAIKEAYALMQGHVSCEPSSGIGLAGLRDAPINKNKTIILINSGKGKLPLRCQKSTR